MNTNILLIYQAIKLISGLPESDLKEEAILTLNLLLSQTLKQSDWNKQY